MNSVFLHELFLRANSDATFLLIYFHNYNMSIVFLVNCFVMITKTALIYISFITFHTDRDFIIENLFKCGHLEKINPQNSQEFTFLCKFNLGT